METFEALCHPHLIQRDAHYLVVRDCHTYDSVEYLFCAKDNIAGSFGISGLDVRNIGT